MWFELEANNYNKELESKNFVDGWVEDETYSDKPPGSVFSCYL